MSDWRQATLGEFVRLQRGHDLTEAERSDGSIPVIGSAGQNGWHGVARCKGPGVTVGRSGASAGVITYVPQDYWPHNTVLYVTDFLGNDPLFAAFMLKTLPLAELNSGSAQASLNRNFLYHVPVCIPPLETQRRIAGILGAYDDLIEVNRRRIGVLEEMARRLFTEWFIRLRFPGHENVAVEDNADGPLPAGWHVRCVEDFGDVITGKTPSKAEPLFAGDDIPFVKIPDLHGTLFVHQTGEMLSEKGAASQANKTVPAGSICVSCIGTIGLVGVTTRACQTNQQINTVVPHTAEATEFLYFSFLRAKSDLVNLGSNGATMGNVNKRKFSEMKLVCPPQVLINEFHRRISPAIALVRTLEVSNLRLTAARDLLLPRLISGQLSVTEAERQLEAA